MSLSTDDLIYLIAFCLNQKVGNLKTAILIGQTGVYA